MSTADDTIKILTENLKRFDPLGVRGEELRALFDEVVKLRKQLDIAMEELDSIDSMSMCWPFAPDPRDLARAINRRAGEVLVKIEALEGGGDGQKEAVPSSEA